MMSAEGLYVQSTTEQPNAVSDGFHCSDFSTASGIADPTIKQAHFTIIDNLLR